MRNRIIIMVSALVLVVAAYFVLVKVEPNKKPDDVPKIESISLFKTESENIASITIATPDFEYTLEKSNENWFKKGNTDASYLNQSSVTSLVSDFSSISAEALIAEDGNLADYGLDKPLGTPTIKLNDGTEKKFIIGNLAPTGSGYYFKEADSNTIYTLYSFKGEKFLAPIDDYRNRTITTVTAENLTAFKLKRKDNDISIRAKNENELKGNSMNTWIMTSPYNEECSNDVISKEIFEKLKFEVKDFVDDNPASYAPFGLENPKYTITVEEKEKEPTTIHLGNEKEGVIYAKTSTAPYVYTIELSSASYKDIDPLLMINTLIYLKNIDTVNSITVYTDNTYTLKIVRDGENATYYINDISADESKFKKTYQEIIGLSLRGIVNQPVTGKLMCKIVFSFNNGEPDGVLEIHEYGDRNAAVKINGNAKYFIMREQVNTMLSSVKALFENPAKE